MAETGEIVLSRVVIPEFVIQVIDILEDVPAVHPFLVVGRGGGDGEVVALVSVPLRIHPVQRKRLYSQYIRINRAPTATGAGSPATA